MALPQGFVLEEQSAQEVSLPSGFQLEQPGAAAPSQGQRAGGLTGVGRGLASLADVTLGAVAPTVVQQVLYPFVRSGRSPEEATDITRRVVSAIDQPFGRAFGVAGTPEYEQEAGRQIMNFIGENFQKGAKWISERIGIPQADVENMMGTLTAAAPAIARPVVQATREAAPALIERGRTALQMPFEEQIRARQERLSLEDYARGPQIDAAAEARRLGLALDPIDVQPTIGSKVTSTLAGERGMQAITEVNRNKVRDIALRELDLPATADLSKKSSFDVARAKLAGPYNQVRQLPTMTADNATIAALSRLRPDESLIGSEKFAKSTNAIIDSAVDKVLKGINGEDLLRNVQTLRQRARKIHNNKNADLASLEFADTNLAIANTLESMIESNIFNPRLLDQFRDARRQMARTYVYEGATDFNTGMIDVNKLSRISSKDNTLTGDIASLAKVAGNFPDAFEVKPRSTKDKTITIGRTGAAGSLGGIAGYALGGGYDAAVLGGLLGAAAGEGVQALAARRMASPEYQRSLNLRDLRIPVGQAATTMQPIPQGQAIVPYQAPVEVLAPGEGPYRPNFTMPQQPRVTPVMPEMSRALPAPSAEGTLGALRAEDLRRAQTSRAVGQQAEAQTAAAEAAARRPTSGEVILDFDPVTGRLRESSQGVRGATPETFSNFGAALETAASKVTSGRRFDLTAAEKVAWDRTRVDLAEVAPGFKALSDKAIAERMLDRKWVQDTAAKAKEKADAFDKIALRAKTEQNRLRALADRDRMLDLAEQMEETLRAPRPDVSRKQQGPKTRAAFRESLFSQEPVIDVPVNPSGLFSSRR